MNSSAYEAGQKLGYFIVVALVLLMAVAGVVFCVIAIRKAMKGGGGGWIAGAIVSGMLAMVGMLGSLGLVASMVAPAMLKAREAALAKKGDTLVTSDDGSMSLSIPADWKKSANFSEDAELCAEGPFQRVCAMVVRDSKEDIAGDLADFDDLTVSSIKEALKQPLISDAEARTINGFPALYRRLAGGIDTVNVVYHRISLETADSFVQVMVWTTPSREKAELPEMMRVLESFQSTEGSP